MPASNKESFALTSAYIEALHDVGIAVAWPGSEPVASHDCISLNLLESAVNQPFQSGYGMDFYPTVFDKAACLFFLIAGGHLFTNGNKRTAVLALDQFLYANAIYLNLSNDQMQRIARQTASYRTRDENHKDVMAKLSKAIEENNFSFKAVRNSKKTFYRKLHTIKRMIRTDPLNSPDARPEQARFRGVALP